MEKAYVTMKNSGAGNIAVGIIILVVGITAGVLSIVSGANLLKHKKRLRFNREETVQGGGSRPVPFSKCQGNYFGYKKSECYQGIWKSPVFIICRIFDLFSVCCRVVRQNRDRRGLPV